MPAITKIDAAKLYAARFEEKKAWAEIRVEFGVSYRSSQFLAELGEYVRADSALLAKHPEFDAIDGAAATDIEHPDYLATRELIRAERVRGVGFRMLADRTGLAIAQIRKIVGEQDVVGTTARIGYRARYGGRKPVENAPETPADPSADLPGENAPEPTEAEVAAAVASDAPETAPAAPKRRRRAKNAPAA